jgi:hypothetical protein
VRSGIKGPNNKSSNSGRSLKMSLASDELDESQITAMDLPLEFKVN